jgi:DNA-binding response OmpR family regulator
MTDVFHELKVLQLRNQELTEQLKDERDRIKRLEIEIKGPRHLRIGVRLNLTAVQAAMLDCLLARPGRCVTRQLMLEAVYWGYPDLPTKRDCHVDVKVFDVQVCHMRRKLRPYGIEIKTVWGRGYMLEHEAVRRIEDLLRERDRLTEGLNVSPSSNGNAGAVTSQRVGEDA